MNSKKFNSRINIKSLGEGFSSSFNINYEDIKNKITPLKYDIYSKMFGGPNYMMIEIIFYINLHIIVDSVNERLKMPIFKAIMWTDRKYGRLNYDMNFDRLIEIDRANMSFTDYRKYLRNMDKALSKLYEKVFYKNNNLNIISEINVDQIREDVKNHILEKIEKKKYIYIDDNVSDDLIIDYRYINEQLKRVKAHSYNSIYEIKNKYKKNIKPIELRFIAENEYDTESKEFLIIESRIEDIGSFTYLEILLGKTVPNDYQTLLRYNLVNIDYTIALSRIPEMKKKMNMADKAFEDFFTYLTVIS